MKIFRKLLIKLYFVNFEIFPYLWLLVFSLALIKVFFLVDILEINNYLNPNNLFLLALFLGFLTVFHKRRQGKQPLYKFIYRVGTLGLLISIPLYALFLYLELTAWPNYVLSTFHVRLASLSWLIIISLIPAAVNIFSLSLSLILDFLILAIIVTSLFNIINFFSKDTKYMFNHPLATYDDKMKEKVGSLFYDYMKFIKTNTEFDAKILIPPFPFYPWPQTGNGQYMGYFLFPRFLVSGEEYRQPDNLSHFDYVLLAYGEAEVTSGGATYGWPKFDVRATEVVYFTPGKERVEKPGNYIYKNVEGQKLWGIIKVKK